MRWLVRFVLVFALAVAIALIAHYSDGYALIVYPPYRIELSLPVLILGALTLFFVLYALLRALSHTLRLPSYVATFRRKRRETRGHAALRNAWEAQFEGRYGRASKFAARAYELNATPAIAALLAARAAHALRDFVRRDAWLERAAGAPGASRQARLICVAEMLLEERRFEEARGVLRELQDSGPKQVATLRLLLRAEQGLQNWDEVLRLLGILDKRDPLARAGLQQLRFTAIDENLKKKATNGEGLREFWHSLPEAQRLEPRLAFQAARLFIQLGGCKEAHRLIDAALEHQWSSELILLYGECRDEDALQRLQRCEKWLNAHPRDAALLLTLGRLCAYLGLWGKAQSYLEASISQQPTRRAHRELARLFEQIEREDSADRHYRAAADEGLPT